MNLIKKILAFIFKDPRRKDATTKVSGVGSKTKWPRPPLHGGGFLLKRVYTI